MTHHINPRFRAYGKARLDIARRARSREEWERLWKPTMHPFAFRWGRRWKHCIEYRVDDFAAEVGFFLDVLGFPVHAFDENYAMFTSPDEAFHLAILPADKHHPATPPDALRLQFMLDNLESTVEDLRRRGVEFALPPQALKPGSSLHIAVFYTPHGLAVELWCEVSAERQPPLPAVLTPSGERPPAGRLPLAAAPLPDALPGNPPQEEAPSSPAPPQVPPRPARPLSPAGEEKPLEALSPPPEVAPSRAASSRRAPLRPRIAVRQSPRKTLPRRSNRLPARFTPVPTVPRPAASPPAKENPSPPESQSLEPEYEDLPEALYPEDLP